MPASRQSFLGVILSLILGFAYIELTLPHATMKIATHYGWTSVSALADASINVNQRLASNLPSFPDLLQYLLYAVVIYLATLLFLALRHGQLEFFGWGVFALVVSTWIFHIIAWGGYVLIKLMGLLRIVFGFFGVIIAAVVLFLGQLIAKVAEFAYHLLRQLLGDFWWVGLAAVVALIAVVILQRSRALAEAIKAVITLLIGIAASLGVFYLFGLLWRVIGPFVLAVLHALRAVLQFVYRILGVAVIALGVLLAIATVGQLLFDQFKSAMRAGNRRFGIIMGGIAIGSSLAILLVVSNSYSVNSALPVQVTDLFVNYLYHKAPMLDALISLAIVAVSITSVSRNLVSLSTEPTIDEFGKSLVYAAVGVFFAGALAAISAQTEE